MLTQPHPEADLGSAIYILMALLFFFSTKKDMIFNTTYIAKIFQRQDEGEKWQWFNHFKGICNQLDSSNEMLSFF